MRSLLLHCSTGNFDKNAFLEMMAPLGYRAHPSVSRVVTRLKMIGPDGTNSGVRHMCVDEVCKDGKEVRLVQWSKDHLHFEGWLLPGCKGRLLQKHLLGRCEC